MPTRFSNSVSDPAEQWKVCLPILQQHAMQVAIGRWRPDGMPSFAEYDAQRQSLWQQPKWARGVLVRCFVPQLLLHPGLDLSYLHAL